MKQLTNLISKPLVVTFIVLNLIACSDDPSTVRASQPEGKAAWDSKQACQDQELDVGIPGNIYCPYKGQSYGGKVEAFAKVEWHGAVYLDFGLQYNDACPPGEVPVYEYSYGQNRLKSCDFIGNDYVDNIFYQHHNISSCSGGYAGNRNCIPGM